MGQKSSKRKQGKVVVPLQRLNLNKTKSVAHFSSKEGLVGLGWNRKITEADDDDVMSISAETQKPLSPRTPREEEIYNLQQRIKKNLKRDMKQQSSPCLSKSSYSWAS